MAIVLTPWRAPLNSFMKWLEAQDRQTAQQWCKRVRSSEQTKVEGAVAEALVWDYINCRVDSVEQVDLSGIGGVDFCFAVNGSRFLIEVTNISIESATRVTQLPDREITSGYYGLLTTKIRSKVRGKLKQSIKAPNLPILIAVTTLHRNASISCCTRLGVEFAMSSPPKATIDINPVTGEVTGDIYESTNLKKSIFLNPPDETDESDGEINAEMHRPIAGFLLAGFGVNANQVEMFGGLNPEAQHPFDPALLPNEPFCFIDPWPTKNIITLKWSISQEEVQAKKHSAVEARLRKSELWELTQSIKNEFHSSSN